MSDEKAGRKENNCGHQPMFQPPSARCGNRFDQRRSGKSVGRTVKSALSDRLLRQRISALQKLERRCFASRNRFAFYRYLAAIYAFYAELRQTDKTEEATRRVAELFNLDSRQHAHPIRLIIDASSQAAGASKRRWVRALRYAWRERRRWSDLEAFLRQNGGPAGCAGQFAALHPRALGGCARLAGESRVPKVPLFFSRDMLH